ncbi:hypothetical protein [Knoellia remsis]|uniref:hypothetical protein n=1 Tax=Knoellia remsis TaxID=407159 RepID=UPI0011B1DD4B|nr:hypothetical protein [Knoellia remsis]
MATTRRFPAGVRGGVFALTVASGLATVLTPVLVNGDPVSLGWWGIFHGASVGTAVGTAVAVVLVVVLVGGDEDSGYTAERLALGVRPQRTAMIQCGVAIACGMAAWTITALLTGLFALVDIAARLVFAGHAAVVPPDPLVIRVGLAGPVVVVGATVVAAAWIVAWRSAFRAGVALAVLAASLLAVVTSVGQSPWLLLAHPLGPGWRALSETTWGRDLPGAVTTHDTGFAAAGLLWAVALTVVAGRGFRRLGVR